MLYKIILKTVSLVKYSMTVEIFSFLTPTSNHYSLHDSKKAHTAVGRGRGLPCSPTTFPEPLGPTPVPPWRQRSQGLKIRLPEFKTHLSTWPQDPKQVTPAAASISPMYIVCKAPLNRVAVKVLMSESK